MRKEEITAVTVNLFECQMSKPCGRYESLKISISYLNGYDVLTASTGTADDDNVGGFMDAWRE